jgi:hypothetical protein
VGDLILPRHGVGFQEMGHQEVCEPLSAPESRCPTPKLYLPRQTKVRALSIHAAFAIDIDVIHSHVLSGAVHVVSDIFQGYPV